MGGGFCTGSSASDCCPFFNNDTGACVDNCTTINPDFGPNEDFVCGELICKGATSISLNFVDSYIYLRTYANMQCAIFPVIRATL